jgi:DNA-binding NtrC family response regulator
MEKKLFPEFPILMVDDEKHLLNSLDFELRSHGINNVECCQDSRNVMSRLKEKKYSVVLLDILMPYISGDELLPEIVDQYPDTPVIIITACPDEKISSDCMKNGAFDCLIKPIETRDLIRTIHEALDLKDTHKEIILHKKQLFSETPSENRSFLNVITCCANMLSICQAIGLVAFTSRPVLVMGEDGVGKEFLACEIHNQSHRKGKFVSRDITGLNDELFTDILFGYKKVTSDGTEIIIGGLVDDARRGTLFLKEIGELAIESQARLLRLIQNREYSPLDSNDSKSANARIVAGTSKNLSALIQIGAFRQDLYARFQPHEIHIPPLRERKKDIPLLVDHFLEKAAEKAGIEKPDVPDELFPLLEKYDFPGNVSELKKMVADAVNRCEAGVLPLDAFSKNIKK